MVLHFMSAFFCQEFSIDAVLSVLIHTSLLINYSVYSLIRYPDRVNNCSSVSLAAACSQTSSNKATVNSLEHHCICRQGNIWMGKQGLTSCPTITLFSYCLTIYLFIFCFVAESHLCVRGMPLELYVCSSFQVRYAYHIFLFTI